MREPGPNLVLKSCELLLRGLEVRERVPPRLEQDAVLGLVGCTLEEHRDEEVCEHNQLAQDAEKIVGRKLVRGEAREYL